MKRKNTLKLCLIMLTVLMLTSLLPLPVSADIGPKASVRVEIENLGKELCYGTLLSEKPSTGPQSAWDGNEDHIYNDGLDIDIWRAFAEYKDTDGYYFLQLAWNVSERGEIAWTYYPPNRFKILLYFPESNTFAVSGIYEKYAFDTYYTVDMDGMNIGSVNYDSEKSTDERIVAYRSYNYRMELLSLAARIVITIAIEMLIALLFGFYRKKEFLLLAAVNTVTQIGLNVLLNVVNFSSGEWAAVFWYVICELLVFAAEAVLYCTLMGRLSDKPRKTGFYILYAFIANAVSFASGLIAAHLIPGIF